MKSFVFGIYDVKLQEYMQPFVAPTKPVAMRMFEDECRNPESMFHKHPDDYNLHVLADFDSESGSFENVQVENLCSAADFK